MEPQSQSQKRGLVPSGYWRIVIVALCLVESAIIWRLVVARAAYQRSQDAGCLDECLGILVVIWWGFWLYAWPFAGAALAAILRVIWRRLSPRPKA